MAVFTQRWGWVIVLCALGCDTAGHTQPVNVIAEPTQNDTPGGAPVDIVPAPPTVATATPAPPSTASAWAAASAKAAANARAAERVRKELDALDVALLDSLKGSGKATGVLANSDVPTGMLDDKIRSPRSGQTNPGTGNIGRKVPAGGGKVAGRSGPTSSVEKKRRPPRGTATIEKVEADGVSNAQSVVARMRGRFRACYNKGLATKSSLAGTIKLRFFVGPKGDVILPKRDYALVIDGVPEINSCIFAVIKSGGFAAPESGARTEVTLTLEFAKDKS